MEYTKEIIQDKLKTDRDWIERALVVLHNFQTEDEQRIDDTTENNGIGFTGFDGKYLSKCARWVKRGNHLDEKYLESCKKKLPKYWKQIKKVIEMKNKEVV